MNWTFGVLLAAACGFAQAADLKSPAGSCEAFSAAVDSGLKELAAIRAQGIGDDSAPRETYRQAQKLVAVNLMQLNLNILQANKCPLPKEPLSDSVYYSEALKCVTAVMKADSAGPAAQVECDRSKWKK